jgi:hypothetical protein
MVLQQFVDGFDILNGCFTDHPRYFRFIGHSQSLNFAWFRTRKSSRMATITVLILATTLKCTATS